MSNKGYIEAWTPRGKTLELVNQANEVFLDYRDHLPLTLRQVFYALVASHGYEKSERAYKKLSSVLANARRAGMVPMGYLRDDGPSPSYVGGYRDKSVFLRGLKNSARFYSLDPTIGQPVATFVVCEAAGMARLLERVCRPYGVPVLASGGFGSLTSKHSFAGDVREEIVAGKDVVVLTLGDLDPSGLSIMEDFQADVSAFYGHPIELSFERILLTWEQAEEWELESAPAKSTDTRSRTWGDRPTYQLEAVPPGLLAETVEEAITRHVDLYILQDLREREQRERAELIELLNGWEF